MSTLAAPERTTSVPTGTWTSDLIHSWLGFSARHMVVSTFRGEFPDFQATLDDGVLTGTAPVSSVVTRDENLTGHLASPDFFDAERHPEVTFRSTSITFEGSELVVDGELTMRGATKPLTLRGALSGPAEDPYGIERIGIELSGVVDRREFGMVWQADMPGGGFVLGNDVVIQAQLELMRQG